MLIRSEQMLPMPDEVVLPAFRVNGEWPQINGPEQVTMIARAADLVDQGKLSWETFYTMGGLTAAQTLQIARMLNGYHERYKIAARVVTDDGPIPEGLRIITPDQLAAQATGWRHGAEEGKRAYHYSTNYLDPPRGVADRNLFVAQKMRALSMMVQVGGAILDHPDVLQASEEYRERLSQIYQDPFASRRDRSELTIPTNREVREIVAGAVMDSRHGIGDVTGYTPREATITSWAHAAFPFGANS